MMRRLAVLFFAACASMGVMAQNSLSFDPSSGRKASLTFHDGSMVNYVAYERLFYVANVEDSTYQYLNVFVPDGATQQSPIFLRTYVGGYMASEASLPQAVQTLSALSLSKTCLPLSRHSLLSLSCIKA